MTKGSKAGDDGMTGIAISISHYHYSYTCYSLTNHHFTSISGIAALVLHPS